ncbi:MAG: hypothetical protein L0216_01565 [Planctomycetales bacterium]|nr:hypothetical protein [Planctomycetales bacterium]
MAEHGFVNDADYFNTRGRSVVVERALEIRRAAEFVRVKSALTLGPRAAERVAAALGRALDALAEAAAIVEAAPRAALPDGGEVPIIYAAAPAMPMVRAPEAPAMAR